MRRQKAALLLAPLLAVSMMLPAQSAPPEDAPPSAKSPLRKALEKSLLFPGLGQLSEKQYLKAALFGSAEIFCLVQIFIFMSKGNDAYTRYRDAADAAAAVEFRLLTEKYDKRRNSAILAAAGVWVVNMIDMFVFAKKKYKRNAAIGIAPHFNHENKTIGAGIHLCF